MHNRIEKRSSATAKDSKRIHSSRNTIAFYPNSSAKRVISIIAVIISIIICVILFLSFYFTNEHFVKSKIESLANNYYENYFYDNATSNVAKDDFTKVLEHYSETGFSSVTLRQILYRNDDKKDEEYILKYCDENSTYIKFYPVKPFDEKSYRVEFNYSCEF